MFTGFLLGAGAVLAVLFGWNVMEDAVRAVRRKRLADAPPFKRLSHTILTRHNDTKKVDRLLGIKK